MSQNLPSSIRYTTRNPNARPPTSHPSTILLNGTCVKIVPHSRSSKSSLSFPLSSPRRTHTTIRSFPPHVHNPATSTITPSSNFPSSSSPPSRTTNTAPAPCSMNTLPPPPSQQQVPKQSSSLSTPPNLPTLPSLPQWNDDIDDPFDALSSSASGDTATPPPSPAAQNFFIHNGYRYDGDVFELRPPQERSIASRPERTLKHQPALLPHRQIFNRVYSEGTYNTRPSSLRQPSNRTSSRFSSGTLEDLISSPHVINMDAPGSGQASIPVTRPGSIRPDMPIKSSLCETIEAVRKSATVSGDHKLQGLLAYSPVPVTRISGEKPDVLSKVQVAKYHPDEFYVLPEVAEPRCVCGDENYPAPVQEKRGRSYTSFAKSTPYKKPDSGNREEDKAPQKRPFWRLLTR